MRVRESQGRNETATDSNSPAPCKCFMAQCCCNARQKGRDGKKGKVRSEKRRELIQLMNIWLCGGTSPCGKIHPSVPGSCFFCKIIINWPCRVHLRGNLAWCLQGPTKQGLITELNLTESIEGEKLERNIAWDILQFVGSSLSSHKVHLSCPGDPIIQHGVPDCGTLYFNSKELKQDVNFIVYLHRLLHTSWLLAKAYVLDWSTGAWITDSKYHTQPPFEMTSAGPKKLTFMKWILHFSLLHPLGLTLPCWSREAPRRPRPWAQWRTGCRPSAWRDTATTSLPPATPLQRLWSTWHKSEYGREKLRAEKKEIGKEKC